MKTRVKIENVDGGYRPYFVVNGGKEYPFEGRVFRSRREVSEALQLAYAGWGYNHGWITL